MKSKYKAWPDHVMTAKSQMVWMSKVKRMAKPTPVNV